MTSTGQLPVALVTGGSSGIGRECALALAATHEVWLTYNRGQPAAQKVLEAIRSRGGRAWAVPLDLSKAESIQVLYEALVHEMATEGREPRLDALVANAAVFGDAYRFLFEIEEEEWDRVWATNTTGIIRLVRSFLELLLPGGTIVNISSISVPVGAISYKSHAHYTTSKAASARFIDAIDAEYADRGLRCVNLVAGLVDTRMLRGEFGADVSSYEMQIPMQRFATPEEIACLVVRLLSTPALFIRRIVADGGWLQKGWARI